MTTPAVLIVCLLAAVLRLIQALSLLGYEAGLVWSI